VHFSTLDEYLSFHMVITADSVKRLRSIHDLRKPSLTLRGSEIPAKEYLEGVYGNVVDFSTRFIALCGPA